MTHKCFWENQLDIPRYPKELAVPKDLKTFQNSRHTMREDHNRPARARLALDTSQIKPQWGGSHYF